MQSLDAKFGHSFLAAPLRDLEKQCRPRSLQKLDYLSATQLNIYFSTAIEGLSLVRTNHESLPILWAMDEFGDIWFSMEEVFNIYSAKYQFPLARGALLDKSQAKLGHPSLLKNATGRIAGEIEYDPYYGEHHWVISNRSGRFGFPSHREIGHLLAAAEIFKDHGIMLDVFYISPRPQSI